MPALRRALPILIVAAFSIALTAALAQAGESSGPAAASKKGKKAKHGKRCKKGLVKVKGKCRKKKAPAKPTPPPVTPTPPAIVPQIGEYNGDAVVKAFKLVAYPGAQGRVELQATAPAAGCKYKSALSMTVSDRGEFAIVNDNKFSLQYKVTDESGGFANRVEGTWTSSTTVTGTVQMIEVHEGETCDTGPVAFSLTVK